MSLGSRDDRGSLKGSLGTHIQVGDQAEGMASHQPRATRIAIQAGSVLRIRPLADDAARGLARLALTGVGELRAQGFGRFVVGHPLLEKDRFRLATLRAKNFIAGAVRTDEQEEQS